MDTFKKNNSRQQQGEGKDNMADENQLSRNRSLKETPAAVKKLWILQKLRVNATVRDASKWHVQTPSTVGNIAESL